tara:strand:+ start:1490 stop:1780 length:291 start_codon:yes stop_codon:yes gene_type:complete
MTNNKLIAEFMGINVVTEDDIRANKNPTISSYEGYLDEDLEYHSSWDWLMPVANEIIKSRDEQNADWDLTDLKYALCTTNIEWVYKAVVNFIKQIK